MGTDIFTFPNFSITKSFAFKRRKKTILLLQGPWWAFRTQSAQNSLVTSEGRDGIPVALAPQEWWLKRSALPFLCELLLVYYFFNHCFIVFDSHFWFISLTPDLCLFFVLASDCSLWNCHHCNEWLKASPCPSLILIHSIRGRFYHQFLREKN